MKYKLTNQTKKYYGRTLHRIECVESFSKVKVGDLGGWVESKDNLSQSGDAWVSGDAVVKSSRDYIVLRNYWSSCRYFTFTSSNQKWKVGCFYGTGAELIEKAYKDSELSGKCYEASVRYVEEIERIKSEVNKEKENNQ